MKNLSSKGDVVKPGVAPAVDVADFLFLDLPLRKSLRSNPLPVRSLETQVVSNSYSQISILHFYIYWSFHLSLNFPIVWPTCNLKSDVKVLGYDCWSQL